MQTAEIISVKLCMYNAIKIHDECKPEKFVMTSVTQALQFIQLFVNTICGS